MQWLNSLEMIHQEQLNDNLGHAAREQLKQKVAPAMVDQHVRLKDSDINNSIKAGSKSSDPSDYQVCSDN